MMAVNYLTEVVETEDLIRRSLTCRDLVDEAKNYYLSLHKVISHHCIKNIMSSIRAKPRKSTAGVLFVVGGRCASGDPFKSIECCDLRSDKWIRIMEMTTKRRHVGVMAIKNKVYAVGGHDGKEHLNTMEVFDSKMNRWKTLASMKNRRRGVAIAHLGGPLYAVGGLDDTMCFNDVERYDPVSNTWSCAASLNSPRGGVAVACLDGYIYAVGGNDGSTTLNSCERYDPHLNKWTVISPMKTRRAGLGLAAVNGYLYVIGGFDDSSPLSTVERYDPETDSWCFMEPLLTCRGGVGVSVLGGKIFAVGGHDGSHYLTSAECYNVDIPIVPVMLDEALEYLSERPRVDRSFSYEIIVVDDGSKDKTSEVALKYSEKYTVDKVRVLTLVKNRGKGGAVRLGMLSARGRHLLFAGADGASKFADVIKLEESLKKMGNRENMAIVCGSRSHLEKDSVAQRSYFRTVLMYGFHFVLWFLCVRGINDTQCGFKLMTREAARVLFTTLHVQRWAFDVELLYIAQKLKIPIGEVAVNWQEIDGSKMVPVFSWIQMGKDILLIRLRYLLRIWRIPALKATKQE